MPQHGDSDSRSAVDILIASDRVPANARPDLLDGMFSRSNQKNGTQPQALAGSIAMFASHLLNHPDSYPDEVLSRVAHKHASLGLKPEEYPTVHEHLFKAIAADLGDAATPEVVAAWDEVYWIMAAVLVDFEKALYDEAQVRETVLHEIAHALAGPRADRHQPGPQHHRGGTRAGRDLERPAALEPARPRAVRLLCALRGAPLRGVGRG